jgi:aminopeptidase-like protein
MKLKPILISLYPLHRTLSSSGTDEALKIVGENLPERANYRIDSYTPGTQVWTWTVPERYEVKEAYLEIKDGERIVDFHQNPLYLVSYSLPVDKELTWEELEPHLYYNPDRPLAIPWKYKYYERDWGFSLPKDTFDHLPRDQKYRAVIQSEYLTGESNGFKVATGIIHPVGGISESSGEMIISSHICHPMQANDDLSGTVTSIGVAKRLDENPLPPGSMSIRFWYGPETIGTISYLAHHEDLIPRMKAGIFAEMTGNQNTLAWHHTWQHDHLLDRITAFVMGKKEHVERDFAAAPANDERVINGPGVGVPCISINRWPYDEYHTSDDKPEIIQEEMLLESVEVIEEIVRIFATNYIPKRRFRGPFFLSGQGLYVDWQENWKLNRALEKIMMMFEGNHSIFDIAQETDLDYWVVRDFVDKFKEKGMIDAIPIPSEAMTE